MGIKMCKHDVKTHDIEDGSDSGFDTDCELKYPEDPEDQEWYHPGFELSQAIQAMKNMGNTEGTYLVTNAPNTERETYYIVRRGEKCSDIGYCVVEYSYWSENNSGFRISDTENLFPSVLHLIQHSKLNPIPITTVPEETTFQKTLKDPLLLCRECGKCISREVRKIEQSNSEKNEVNRRRRKSKFQVLRTIIIAKVKLFVNKIQSK